MAKIAAERHRVQIGAAESELAASNLYLLGLGGVGVTFSCFLVDVHLGARSWAIGADFPVSSAASASLRFSS